MKRARSDVVDKKLGLMRGKFVTTLATDSLPWMSLWLGTQMKVMERGIKDEVASRVWTRVTKRLKECTLEMTDRAEKIWMGWG